MVFPIRTVTKPFSDFTKSYEIISSVIQKDISLWNAFVKAHEEDFSDLRQRYASHPLFSENESELNIALYGCYPLHPVSTFILPRLSERVAQNERTLFTFLSATGTATLPSYLEHASDEKVSLITPDVIYDYFEPLFKKEVYAGEIHQNYILTANILSRLASDSLEAKIVKTLSLFYVLGQFERLKPTKDEIAGVFSTSYTLPQINEAIDNLIEREFVIYLKRSNEYLKLKQTSGIDIKQKIQDYAESHAQRASVKETLNGANFDNYMYPSRYNDDREMTRYFSFVFIDEDEVRPETNWIKIIELVVNSNLTYDLQRIQFQFDEVKPDFVIVSHASNVIGLIAPVEEIFTLAKKYGAVTLIDMAQTAGLVDCDIGKDIFDFAVFAGHKTLLGPTGISGFVMNPSIKLVPVFFGGTGFDSANQDMPDSLPERFEFGTLNSVGLAGLNASAKWILQQGITNLEAVEKANRVRLLTLLRSYDFISIIGDANAIYVAAGAKSLITALRCPQLSLLNSPVNSNSSA